MHANLPLAIYVCYIETGSRTWDKLLAQNSGTLNRHTTKSSITVNISDWSSKQILMRSLPYDEIEVKYHTLYSCLSQLHHT